MAAIALDEPALRPAPASADLEWPSIPPTLVTVHRTSLDDEQSRQIVFRLDDGAPVTLLFGDTHTLEVLPGPHTLKVHNTLIWKSSTFEVPPGGHAHFTVLNRPSAGYYWLMLLLGAAPLWLELRRGAPG